MSKNISKGDLRKQDFLVLKQSRDDTVTNVVAPNGLQIGLTDDRFRNPLTVKGSTIGEGGITGSLTQLVDGTSYLRAGQNITITTGSTGQITISNDIAAVAVRRNKQQYENTTLKTAGTTVSLTNSAFNSIGITDTDDFIDVYHNNALLLSGSVSDVTAGTKDYYIDPTNNTAVFGFDLVVNDTIITSVISSGSAQLAGAGDALSLTNNTYNVNVGSTGGIQVTSDALALKFKSAGGLSSDSDGVFVDINSQTNLGASVDTGDFVLVYDVTDGAIKKVSVGNIQGSGATIDIAGVSNSLTETTLATGDLFAVADVDAANETKKITVEDFGQYLASNSNSGIGESSGKLTLDINDLSAAAVDVGADSIAIVDASDNTTKKESISDLIDSVAGTVTDTGLAASSGVLSLDITNQTSVGTISTSDEIIIYDVDASALKKATINDLQAGSAAPPGAQYVTLALDGTLSGERVLTPGDGLDLTDGGAGGNVTLAVDVTDVIDTSYGLTESSNDIRVALKSSGGLTFDSGEIALDYGTTSGLPAAGSNTVNILAGDGLKSGGSFTIGSTTSTVQLDIKPADFAGNGLKVDSDDLVVSIGAGSNISITTGSDGSFIIASSTGADAIYTAGDGLDLNSQEFSVDLKGGGGLKIDSTELAVEPNDFAGNGLQDDGSDNLTVQSDTTSGTGYAPVSVGSNGVAVRYDNTTIGDAGSGVLEVKDGAITADKLQNSSLTVTAGDGLRNGGSVALGSSVQLDINPGDFAGTGLKTDPGFNLLIDDSVVATLSGSAFQGDVEITGTLGVVYGLTALSVTSDNISGSLTTLANGDPYLKAGTGISISTGSDGSVTIVGNVGDITGVTAGTGLTGGGDTGTVTLNVDDSIVATLTGSVFSGHVGVTGSIHSTAEVSGSILKAGKISGSLTTLENGDPYLVAGSGISLATGSDGSVTITGNVGDITAVNVGTGLSGGGDTGDVTVGIDDSVVATLTGSVFSGHVGVTGSIHATAEVSGSILRAPVLTGSLTTLENGSPYLLAGTGISIATGSDGAVTITGNVGDITGVTAGTGLTGGGDTGTVSLAVDDSLVATLSSSVSFPNGISGSLTQLSDGSSFIIAGDNITITSASNGSITIESSFTNTLFTAGTGLQLDGTEFSIRDDVVATLTGSVFSGHVGVTGSIHATAEVSGSIVKANEISGSLTTLENGNPYLLAGSGISLATGSDGSVTITGNVGDITGVTAGTGLSGGGDTGTVTLNIDDSVVATLTSSVPFSNGLSGSLTQLTDGTSYIIAGDNVTVTSASNGAITISSSFTNTEYTAGTGLNLDSTEFSVDDAVVATLTGSVFSGHVGATGSIHSTVEVKAPKLSGSLTTLENGNPYLLAGADIILSTGSDGSVTITGDFTQNAPGSPVNSVQFNTAGDFAGDSDFVYDSSANDLVLSGTINVLTTSLRTTDFANSIDLRAPSSISSDYVLTLPSSNGDASQLLQTDGSGNLSFDFADRVFIDVRNGSGGALTKGTPVHISGYHTTNKRPLVIAADASTAANMPALGILAEDLPTASSEGKVCISGYLGGLNTNPFSVADTLYVGPSGGLTSTKPSGADDAVQAIGICVSDSVSNGIILVKPVGNAEAPNSIDVVEIQAQTITATTGFSGSLTHLADGSSYLIAGENVTITTGSNGAVTIASTGGSGANPASPVNSVQFNDSGVFGGDSDFVYDNLNNVLTLSGTIQQLTSSIFSTDYAGSVSLVVAHDLQTDLTFRLPEQDGLKFQFLQTDSDGNLSFDYSDRVHIQVRNNSGYDLDAGTPVYITGYNSGGDRAYIAASSASLDSTMPAAAILAEDLLNNSNGHAALIGFLEGVDTSAFGVGNTLYVAADGGLTDSKPLDADVLIQNVGFVLKAANNGIMYVTSPGRTNDVPNDLIGRAGLSGSLQMLADGVTRYLIGTGSVSVSTSSNGQIVVSGSDTVYTAGTGLDLTGYQFSVDDSVVATLTGSVFSGTVTAPALSGSLTHLQDGSSYLIAGSNVTIVTGSNGAVTISSTGGGGGGSITATSGSTSVGSMSTIRFGPGLIMNQDSTGIASVTASIGEAEDGTYTDGLFTDFTPQTHIGVAIDRFNEILSALSPSPAPALDNLSEAVTNGITAFLSFGASSDQTSGSPSYPSVLDTAGIGDEVDVNESYSATTSGDNIRLGIYSGAQNIQGVLNEDVVSNSQGGGQVNYPANSFGDGDTGVLKLEVNGSIIKEIDLTVEAGAGSSGAGSADYVNANGSGFLNISEATQGTFSNGNSFETFKHRTGEYRVNAADQRNGWNYLRVQHVKTGSTTTTNYVEWVNDSNSDALSAAGNSLDFEGSGSIHLSGVEYFRSGSLTYKNRVSNAYKYIYDTTNITFSTSNSATYSSGQTFNFVAQTKPTIDTAGGEDHAKQLHLTSSSDIDASYFINGTVTVGTNVTHPLKSNLSNGGQATASQILMYDLSNTSTNLIETFRRENFRIISGSYDTQSDVTNVSNEWDSEVYMTASNGGHSNGLQFFNQRLLSPINTISSGDFTGFSNGPSQNPDYSGETGTRTFYRWFRNTTGADQFDFSLALQGSGTIVSHGTALAASTISVLVKLPGKTGWMDVSGTYVLDSVADNDGASAVTTVISKDLTLNATNYINFGNVKIENNEYVLVCIKADESWTGHVSNITVVVGAGTGTLTPVPDLDDIGCDQDGTDVNLSFGAAKSITGYTDPAAAAGFTAADLNDLYQTAETSNNLRRAVFNGATTLEGHLNADVGSPGNDYVTYAFSDANTGSIKLEVNGVIIHEVEITGSATLVGSGNPGSGTGTSLNADGSGFISLSNWGPGLFDNGVPRYSEIQRTAKYRIVSSSQRDGWNYARVLHEGTWGTRTTNYIEWIVDANSEAMASAGNGLSIFGDNSHSYLSGVKYFNSPSGSILTRISNIYKNVYSDSSSAISFTALSNATASKLVQSGSGLSSTKTTSSSTDSLQTLSTVSDSQNELLHVSGTINFTRSKSLPGTYTTTYSCAGALVFDHPFKTNLTIPTQTTTNLLVWTPSDTSNANTDEYFTGESYRLVSGSYTAQTDVSGGTNDWDSQTSMNDQSSYPEHATGLLIYDTYLIPPKDGGSSGDFRNHDEGGGIESPAGNVNYSSLTNSTRDYFRSFLNNTTNDRPSVQITLYGDANIVGRVGPNSGTLGSNKNIFVEVGVPGKTGFLDLARPSAGSGNYNEGDGCLSGDLTATVNSGGATNTATFNGRTVDGTVSGAEYLVIRISASENWTGYLDRISVSWS